MKIHLLSDLHLEFTGFEPDQQAVHEADVIVLAGDIHKGILGITWARQVFQNKPVIYVAGNHEFYGGHWDGTLQDLRDAAAGSNVHFLENDSVTIDGVRFLGCSLWTDFEFHGAERRGAAMRDVERGLNDYRLIEAEPSPQVYGRNKRHKLTAEHTLRRHRQSRAWLERELGNADPEKTVVVTHHCPRPESVAPRYQEDALTPGFASDLPAELLCRASLWVHGHTHDSCNYQVSVGDQRCNVVCNPRGYLLWGGDMENDLFDGSMVLSLPGRGAQ